MPNEELVSVLTLLREHHAELLDVRQKVATTVVVCGLLISGFQQAYEKQKGLVSTRPRVAELEQELALFDQLIQELRDGKIEIH